LNHSEKPLCPVTVETKRKIKILFRKFSFA
jgi:hypothetical protein